MNPSVIYSESITATRYRCSLSRPALASAGSSKSPFSVLYASPFLVLLSADLYINQVWIRSTVQGATGTPRRDWPSAFSAREEQPSEYLFGPSDLLPLPYLSLVRKSSKRTLVIVSKGPSIHFVTLVHPCLFSLSLSLFRTPTFRRLSGLDSPVLKRCLTSPWQSVSRSSCS